MKHWNFFARLGTASVIVILLIALICAMAYGILLLPPVQNYVCNVAEEKLDSLLEGDVDIGRVRSNLLSRLDVYDIKVRDKCGRDDSVSLGHIRVRYNVLALLNRKVHVTSVFGENLDAAISVTSGKEMKIPVYPDSTLMDSLKVRKKRRGMVVPKPPSKWKVVIGNVRINNVNAVYRDSCLNFTGSVSRTKIRARFPRIDSIQLELRVPQARYSSNWWEGDLDTIGAKATLRFNQLNLHESFVRGPGVEVHGWGKIPFKMKDSWNLYGIVSADMEPIRAIHGFVRGIKPQGHLWADVSWQGTLDNPVLKYATSGSGLSYKNFDIDTLFLHGAYTSDFVASTQGVIFSPQGKTSLNAEIQIPRLMRIPSFENYHANISVGNAKLPLVKEMLNESAKKIPGENAAVELRIKGCGFDKLPDYTLLKIKAEDKLFGNDTLNVTAELINKQWAIDGKLGGDFLEGSGRIQSNGVIHGNVGGQIADAAFLSEYLIKERITGALKFESSVDGMVQKPFIHCKIDSKNLKWRSVRVKSLNSAIQFNGEEVNVESLHAGFSANLDTLAEFLKIGGISGTVTANVNASGLLTALDFSALVSGSEVNYKGYRADSVNANLTVKGYDRISWKDGYIRLEGTEVKTGGQFSLSSMQTEAYMALLRRNAGTAKSAGEIRITGLLAADTVFSGFSISLLDVSAISPWFPAIKDYKGKLSAQGNFEGTWNDLQGKVGARLDQPGFKVHRLASIDCLLGLVDSLLSVKSEILLKDSSSVLHLDASLPLLPSSGWSIDMGGRRDARINLSGKNINLDAIASVLDSNSVTKGSGDIRIEMFNNHGDWELGGNIQIGNSAYFNKTQEIAVNKLKFWTSLSGKITSPQLEYTISTGLVNVQEAKADSIYIKGMSTKDTVKVAEGKIWLPRNGTVRLNAIVPLDHIDSLMIRPGFEIGFDIVKLPLTALSPFIMENMIRSGEINGNGKIRITRGRPLLSGNIGLENGKFAFEEMNPVIGPVSAQVVMNDDSVLIRQIKGKCDKGSFNGNGFIIWNSSGLDQMKIDIKNKDVYLDFKDLAAVRIQSGNIRFTNKRDGGYLISGSVDLGDTRVVRDLRIADLLEQIQKNNITVQKDPFLQSLTIMVEVNLLDNLAVDMNLGDLKMGGAVSIAGTAAQPTYTGEIRVNEGFIYYFDRKFEVTKGSFYNYDPYKLDPLLDLEAVTEVDAISPASKGELQTVESYIIHLSVQGKLSEPEVRLWTEDTPMDEGNIISILTLGQPLGAIGGDLGDRLKSFAQQSIVGFGARKLEQLLGIERIDLKGNLFDFDSENSPTLSLTKRFSPRFLLSYETALGDLTKPKVSAMFRLTKHFFLEGQTDADNYGLDLLFKYSR